MKGKVLKVRGTASVKKRNDLDLVIFDLDGTLVDTALYIIMNYVHLFDKYHKKMPSLTDMVYFSGPPLEDILPRYFPDVPFDKLIREFREFSLRYSNHYSSLYEGETDVLSSLKKAGYKLAVLTSKSREATIDNLQGFDIYQYFDYLLCVDDCPKPKPDPLGVNMILDKLKIERDRALVIGDSESDIVTGKNAGIKTGLVTFGLKRLPEIKADIEYADYGAIRKDLLS